MKFLIQLLCISISFASFAQEKEDWLAFYNQDSTKIGFKDTKGNVKIEARFQPFMTQQVFRNVIAVQETVSDGKTECYYLNKNGKKFGKDSLYVFDFEYASEKEEKIKFFPENGVKFVTGVAIVNGNLQPAHKHFRDIRHLQKIDNNIQAALRLVGKNNYIKQITNHF